MTGDAQPSGRTRVLPRALRSLAAAVTAEELGVSPDSVRIALSDDRGLLRIAATSPIRVSPGGPAVVEGARQAQDAVRVRVGELAGSRVSAVDLTVTDAVSEERGRVR